MYTKPFRILSDANNQIIKWDNNYLKDNDVFGKKPSQSAIYAAKKFKAAGIKTILELGAGQGRDTFYFISQGFKVHIIEYSTVAIRNLQERITAFDVKDSISITNHDLRNPLPFSNDKFGACYSHMLYCMEFSEAELLKLNKEIYRILKPGGYNCFTVRNTKDKEYGIGRSLGNMTYEYGGFIVHFFDENKIKRISDNFQIAEISEFEEGNLPRRLFQVLLNN